MYGYLPVKLSGLHAWLSTHPYGQVLHNSLEAPVGSVLQARRGDLNFRYPPGRLKWGIKKATVKGQKWPDFQVLKDSCHWHVGLWAESTWSCGEIRVLPIHNFKLVQEICRNPVNRSSATLWWAPIYPTSGCNGELKVNQSQNQWFLCLKKPSESACQWHGVFQNLRGAPFFSFHCGFFNVPL